MKRSPEAFVFSDRCHLHHDRGDLISPEERIYNWRVSAEEAGLGLLAFLRKKDVDAPSVKSLKRAIDSKCCTVNGKIEVFSSRSLKKDDRVTLHMRKERSWKSALTVLYEDADLIIVDKPVGLTCENRYFAPLVKARAELIHRLDKETSGVVMLAKNREILERMVDIFREKKIRKQYLAIVDGCVRDGEGRIENKLRKKESRQPGQVFFEATKGRGAIAITEWRCLKKTKVASLLLCEPITGRTHQLRVHLSGMGHPILGDIQYGMRFRCPFRALRHLLHAYTIAFIHPKTQQEIYVEAPIPSDFQEALTALKLE
jgi:RluA family pseudouridine synthase